MLRDSQSNRVVRVIFIGIVILLILVAVIAVVTNNERFELISTLLGALVALAMAPPLEKFVQRAFAPKTTGSDAVRKQMKAYWIDQFLRQEEQAIAGFATITDANPLHTETAQNTCGLRARFERYVKPFDGFEHVNQHMDDPRQVFQFGSATLRISQEDTITTIFEDLTYIVNHDKDVTGEYIVLLGERGSRKTIQLLQLAEHLLERDTRVPVYVNLFSWAAGCRPFVVWLVDEISRQYDVLEWKAERLLRTEYVILLLDGFEEIPHERRRHFIIALRDFMESRLETRQTTYDDDGTDAPIDLRDALVIASTNPFDTGDENNGGEDSFLADPDDFDQLYEDNQQDLDEHLIDLIKMLQKLGLESKNAAVVPIRIKQLEQHEVMEHIRCQLVHKCLASDPRYQWLKSTEKSESYAGRTLTSVEQEAEQQQAEQQQAEQQQAEQQQAGESTYDPVDDAEKDLFPGDDPFNRNDLFNDVLMGLLCKTPFLLRALMYTYRFHHDENKLRSTFVMKIQDKQLVERLADDLFADEDENREKLIHLLEKTAHQHRLLLHTYDCRPDRDNLIRQVAEALSDKQTPSGENNFSLQPIIAALKGDFPDPKRRQCLEKKLTQDIIHSYVDHSLRHQPGNISPYSETERRKLLGKMAYSMQERRQRVLSETDAVFYLENMGLQMLKADRKDRQQFKGFVALFTVGLFVGVYLVYLLVIGFIDASFCSGDDALRQFLRLLNNQAVLNETCEQIGFNPAVEWIGLILISLFARNFGWASCGLRHNEDNNDPMSAAERRDDERVQLLYPVRWYADAGVPAGIFMGLVVGMLFFTISHILYDGINREPLLYESVVVGLFSLAFFLLIGGLELGRRYAIVAYPFDGRNFLLVSALIAAFVWSTLFFSFLFWPRTQLEVLSPEDITVLVQVGLVYSLATGVFIGLMSSLIFSHLYLRHTVLFWYLRITQNLYAPYVQLLNYSAKPQVGLLRQVGGGYLFRHRFIMNYFHKQYENEPSVPSQSEATT